MAGFDLDDVHSNDDFLEKILRVPRVSQFIYNLQLKRNVTEPTAVKKWKGQFSDIDSKDWESFFNMPRKVVSDVELQYFQYRFLHRIIATNKLLYAMGKVECNKCSFCETELESLEHIFWDCSITSAFILDVEFRFLREQFFFSKYDIFFGFGKGSIHPFNYLILNMKSYIYQCKRRGELPKIDVFFQKFKFAMRIEKYSQQSLLRKKNVVSLAELKEAFKECNDLFNINN